MMYMRSMYMMYTSCQEDLKTNTQSIISRGCKINFLMLYEQIKCLQIAALFMSHLKSDQDKLHQPDPVKNIKVFPLQPNWEEMIYRLYTNMKTTFDIYINILVDFSLLLAMSRICRHSNDKQWNRSRKHSGIRGLTPPPIRSASIWTNQW